MPDAPLSVVDWPMAVRLIESKYPPIDLFEDLADPEDWELLAAAETRTNPRVAETIGNLDLVPVARRVSGPGASYVMAPFTHCSPDKPGRFHDGSYGAYYAARNFETAVAEVAYHQARRLADSRDEPGWISDMRELVGAVRTELTDIRGGGFAPLLAPDDYAPSQAFARACRDARRNGIVYPSVRNPGGECVAAFWPDVVAKPLQGRHFRYHWDGRRIDMIRELRLDGDGAIYRLDP
ncbi:RES domain-containing protein [Sphingomonas laterariae]|uniref:RES domain-containing protein n=1 Tax=Edaphosphingomonas laterariae TaxID=861865 RepID=A0A239I8F4_9SPHN|nr:RES family NAD+ phosphorylase [Sphingomonas laterariae]SNS89839.1 RES domain-containing protein [Sphingomonas laterariae]